MHALTIKLKNTYLRIKIKKITQTAKCFASAALYAFACREPWGRVLDEGCQNLNLIDKKTKINLKKF